MSSLVDLTLGVAPKGWSVVAYKPDRILTLAVPDETGAKELTVSLVDHLDRKRVVHDMWLPANAEAWQPAQ